MESKKVSFGFKLAAKPSVLPFNQTEASKETKELIKCLEGQEIKPLVEKKHESPLIIPMIGIQKTSAALASLMKRRAVLLGEDEIVEQENTQFKIDELSNDGNEDLDKKAARELLAQVHTNGGSNEQSNLVLPILKSDELRLDGAKEATIEDYDSIPIQQFGLAMLRGMGWIEPPKKKGGLPDDDTPFLRPKGMGLGADKALKASPLLIQPGTNEILAIKKLAYVRIMGGKHKDAYGQIEGFDDHAGRVIVKMAIGGSKETFNEFMCLPVSKKEFTQYGKCINTTKYEKYKQLENEHGQIIVKSMTRNTRRTNKDASIKSKDLVSIRNYDDDRKEYREEQCRQNYKNEEGERYKPRCDAPSVSRKSNDQYAIEQKVCKEEHPRRNYNNEERIKSRIDNPSTTREINWHNRNSSIEREFKQNNEKKIRSSRSPVRSHLQSKAKPHHDSRFSSPFDRSVDYSNSTKSDTDSAYERKQSRNDNFKKHKLKKSHIRNRHHGNESSDENLGCNHKSNNDKNERKFSKSHRKKKSKKSKRSRSRSRIRR